MMNFWGVGTILFLFLLTQWLGKIANRNPRKCAFISCQDETDNSSLHNQEALYSRIGRPAALREDDHQAQGSFASHISMRSGITDDDHEPAKERILTNDRRPSIVGGEESGQGEFPYFVDMKECGGVLIAPDVVLTAGHCDPRNGTTVLVSGYEWQTDNGDAKEYGVIDFVQHPDFNRWSMNYDFQLVRLDESVNLKTDVIFDLNEDHTVPYNGENLTVIGMGQLEYQGEMSYILNDVEVQYIPNPICDEMMVAKVWDSMLCGAVEGGGKDSCIGDSGGPILIRDGDNHTIVGLVSWGYRCALNGTAGVYSRISVAMPWIKEVVCFEWETEAGFCPGPTPSPLVSLTPSRTPSSAPSTTPQSSVAPSTGPTASPTTHEPTMHPSSSPSSTPTTLDWALRNCTDLELQFKTDYWPEETSFTLTQVDNAQNTSDADVAVIWDVGTSRTTMLRASTEYYWYTCVDPGIANSTCATLNFVDSLGDGLWVSSYILVTWDGEVVFDKRNFGYGATLKLGDGCDGEDE